MASPEEILERWRQACPPDIHREDFWKVARHYFPESRERGKGGSHQYVVSYPRVAELVRDQRVDPALLQPFNRRGEMGIPVSGGRRVKK